MNILIVGDSFAADWSVKYTNVFGWPNLLSKVHNVTNLAQAGVSEYKIYKQLTSVNLDQFDLVIVVHTSPYRVVTRKHPIHFNDFLHKNADLLFNDIKYHYDLSGGRLNRSLQSAHDFFIFHFDQEYQELIYQMLVERIEKLLCNKLSISIITPITMQECIKNQNQVHVRDAQILMGSNNHMSDEDNIQLFEKIVQKIDEIK